LSRSPASQLALAVLATMALSGCIGLEWSRESRNSPPPAGALETLEIGRTTLKDALDLLGAPLDAYEYRQTGVALAYGWYRHDAKGVRVTLPVYERASASVDYTKRRRGLKGLLLLFGEDLLLVSVREGYLEDLTTGFERQAPAVLEDEPAPPPAQDPPR
jgi:hypothetical protein